MHDIILVHYIFAYIFLVHDVYTESLELRQSEWREHSCFAYIISAWYFFNMILV